MYALVASMLPKMGVLKATSVSSNLASGCIEPAFVYSLPIDPKQVAIKLWKLWEFYTNIDLKSEWQHALVPCCLWCSFG